MRCYLFREEIQDAERLVIWDVRQIHYGERRDVCGPRYLTGIGDHFAGDPPTKARIDVGSLRFLSLGVKSNE